MKLVNPRVRWVREGMLLTTLPKDTPMTSDEMQSYYGGIRRGTVLYKQLRRPCTYPRAVLLVEGNKFLIVPLTPDVFIVPVKEQS